LYWQLGPAGARSATVRVTQLRPRGVVSVPEPLNLPPDTDGAGAGSAAAVYAGLWTAVSFGVAAYELSDDKFRQALWPALRRIWLGWKRWRARKTD
jgi:hypothetical protein